MEIQLIQYTNDFLSGQSGLKTGAIIDRLIQENPNQIINISFYGINSITPSFVNGALLYIIDLYGIEYFKKYIKIANLSNKVSLIIKESVNKHLEYKQLFYQNLKTNKFYCALYIRSFPTDIKTAFKNISELTGAQILLNPTDPIFTQLSKSEIEKSECLIGIILETKNQEYIIEQVNYALSINKQCLIICFKNFYLKIEESKKSKLQIIRYDDENLLTTMRNMNHLILNNMVDQPILTSDVTKELTFQDVLFWGSLAIVGDLLIKEIVHPTSNY